MTAGSQDFKTYAGDAAVPVFTVEDAAGAPLDISQATQISWTARRTADAAPTLNKTKTGGPGGITFVTDGTDGKFQVALAAADTAALTGYYLHVAVVTDAFNSPSTVATGRMSVGVAPVWTYSGDPTTTPKDAVRFLVGDTVEADPQVMDPEITFALTQRASPYGAAAVICRALAARLAREADTVDKDIRTTLSQRSKAYLMMASDYEMQASFRSGASPYAGGISIADRSRQIGNTDRVQPNFNIGMTDNYIPDGIVGNEDLNSNND